MSGLRSHGLPFWTVEPCNRPQKAAVVLVTMGTNGAKAPRYTWLLTRWGSCWAVLVTPANEQDRAQVAALAEQIQEATGESVEVAFVDQGYTGDQPAANAEAHGIHLEVVKLPTAKHGFVLLPRRWVVERSFAWMARFRRLARDYERLPETLAGLHFVAFAILLAHRFITFMVQCA
jgi:transposase